MIIIPDETFAELHQQLMLERKAKLKIITDNNKLQRILKEIKIIAEDAVKTTGTISAGFILQKIEQLEEANSKND